MNCATKTPQNKTPQKTHTYSAYVFLPALKQAHFWSILHLQAEVLLSKRAFKAKENSSSSVVFWQE